MASPRIAVAGINPHCGENGLFGREDDDELAPAVAAARAEGSMFPDRFRPTRFITALIRVPSTWSWRFHDMGHIPVKLVAFDSAVNVSLGLPIDRSSADHGTAFDIAGTGKANHVNMLSALDYARRLAMSQALPSV